MKTHQSLMNTELHEMIQSYFDHCYGSLAYEIKQSIFSKSNEIYGELYYYSVVQLLKYLHLTEKDHFLDVGSGLGKIVFQVFLTTPVGSVTGIEINTQRHFIACEIKKMIEKNLPEAFNHQKLYLIHDDFLKIDFHNITVVYVCSTVFSFELLSNMGSQINSMPNVQTVVSFRKLPGLDNFKLIRKMFFQASWDYTSCYLYTRKR